MNKIVTSVALTGDDHNAEDAAPLRYPHKQIELVSLFTGASLLEEAVKTMKISL
jgi:hypothetical protein